MIVSIASGKGGTGKTTVATNLAYSVPNRVKLLDCDVEEPNSYLFLHPQFYGKREVSTVIPEVDESLCSGCGKCMEICRFSAITLVGKQVLTFPELCHSCGGCFEVCEEKAILSSDRKLGVVEFGRCEDLDFVHGRLRVGEAMVPPLIKEVRQFSSTEKHTIIDAPPGTSCPVIAATKNSDFVLLVTEPTPFGLHDLKLAVEAMKLLAIPFGLVINRSDMGDEEVYEYAEKEAIPILMEIPFETKIAQAYSRGIPFSSTDDKWKEKFAQLLTTIELLESQQEKT